MQRHILEQVNLAGEPAFRLGALSVEPPTRQVRLGARAETLEPRVMQALCVLAQAQGGVVSRDTLIERAWGGVVVGDNAINRVISRLRHLADDFGRPFEIETITKVGYRLTVAGEAGAEAGEAVSAATPLARAEAVPVNRRGLLAGAVALAAAAGAGGWWWATRGGSAPPTAADAVVARARVSLRNEDYSDWLNAVASLRQAVAAEPGHGEAWGLLALAEAREARNNPPEAISTAIAKAREAAVRALRIDADNADAETALAILVPQSRQWEVAEAALAKVLLRHPDHLEANHHLGFLRFSVGRVRESVVHARRVAAIDPGYRVGAVALATRLWATGELREAERGFEDVTTRWPASGMGWIARFSFLALTGRPQEALALPRSGIAGPGEAVPLLDLSVQSAEAMASRDEAARAAAVAAHLAARDSGTYPSRLGAGFLLALGRPDLALLFLERLVLGPALGRIKVPKSPLADPYTEVLFWPPFAPLASHPRFRAILKRSGLEDYWTRTGIVPDFRR